MSYKLLDLPYAYNALEPFYDEATIKSHDNIEPKVCVDAFNNSLIKHLKLKLEFSGPRRLLNSIVWKNMCLGGSEFVRGILDEQITNDFSSFENFKQQFTAAAVAAEASGLTLLVWSPYFKELEILQVVKYQDLTQWGVIPLLSVDIWKHAYNLKYRGKRASWVEAWWNLVNWEDVLKRFEENVDIYNDVKVGGSHYTSGRESEQVS